MAAGFHVEQRCIASKCSDAPARRRHQSQPNAVRELYDLGITEEDLDRVGLPAKEWALVGLNGNDIYSEPRGLLAGYGWPQYAVHRGLFHMLLHQKVVERIGPEAVRLGSRVTGYRKNSDASVSALIERADGSNSEARGALLIGADGILRRLPADPRVRSAVLRALLEMPEVARVTYLRLEVIGPRTVFVTGGDVDLTGDDTESHLAVRLRALEAEFCASPAVAGAAPSLSAPDERRSKRRPAPGGVGALGMTERSAEGVLLETERLVLRQFTMSDVDNLAELDADPDVMRFISGGLARLAASW